MGTVSYDKKIEVQTVPEIIGPEKSGPVQKDVTEFETLNLACNIEESHGQMPEITWLKDGVPVEDVLTSDRLWFSRNRTQLHVYRLEVVESGHYTCKVENRAGSSELEIDVHVNRPPRIDGPAEVNIEVVLDQEELNNLAYTAILRIFNCYQFYQNVSSKFRFLAKLSIFGRNFDL